jgi:Zn-dependent peptidase ImmA (M78 family)
MLNPMLPPFNIVRFYEQYQNKGFFAFKIVADGEIKFPAIANLIERYVSVTETIYENASIGDLSAREILAHEFGHLCLKHTIEDIEYIDNDYLNAAFPVPTKIELEADFFGMSLLIPFEMVVARILNDNEHSSIELLSIDFGITEEMAGLQRSRALKFISRYGDKSMGHCHHRLSFIMNSIRRRPVWKGILRL